MLASEIMGWLGAFVMISVTLFYVVFGKESVEQKNIKIFGRKSMIVGNKSAVIPPKVLAYMFISTSFCFVAAMVLYGIGY